MFRELLAASAAMAAVGAYPLVPQASAADGDQVIRVQDGQVRCLLSANYKGRGYAMTVCGLSDGRAFGEAPMSTGKYPVKLNLVVVHGGGETYWEAGPTPTSPAGEVALGVGETYQVNGWTVTTEDLRTVIKNDLSGHGLFVNAVDVREF